MKVIPPYEIMEFVRFKDGEAYLTKELPPEQMKMFENYKETLRKAKEQKRIEIEKFFEINGD